MTRLNPRPPLVSPLRWTPIALAVCLASLPGLAGAQQQPDPASRLSFTLPALPMGPHDGTQPLFFEADTLEGEAGAKTRASGSVRLKQGDLTVRADELVHTQTDNTAEATGNVRITRQGNVFSGPKLRLKLDTLEGEFQHPTYFFARTGGAGHADLVEFLGSNRLRATQATYSSCTPENTLEGKPGEPDWVLETSRITMDFDANEGRAEKAVVRFKGVPILAAPVLTFPLTDQRKSGWLPPSFDYDNKSGFEVSAPYYWNIAPDRDATLTPTLSNRRGPGLDAEFRYLAAHDNGVLHAYGLPDDRVARQARGLVDFKQQGDMNTAGSPTVTNYELRWRRVSDDDYWKDFPRGLPSLTPRLYDSHANIERQLNARNWGLGDSQTTIYAGVQTWQTLRDRDPAADPTLSAIEAPYRREPQLGVRSRSINERGTTWRFQGEFNRFTHEDTNKIMGNRVHAIGQVERPFDFSGLTFVPRLSLNTASYNLDTPLANGSRTVSRTVPTFSLASGATLEREVNLFGRGLVQTLEPRVQYVRTPFVEQTGIPLFDSAPRDFNQYAIYNENAFTGVDRISDANQVTLGVTSRMLDVQTGVETARIGVVQKVLLSDQRINPNGNQPIRQRLSDLLLLGSTSVIPHWNLDGTVQFSAQSHRTERAVTGVRYSPGAWRTVSLNYRYSRQVTTSDGFTREGSEQIDLGWQWPIAGRKPPLTELLDDAGVATGAVRRPSATNQCEGTWYSVGRVNYSLRDGRIADSLFGVEYDAGCWIARVVAERVSVGRADASTRLMFQLELVGLSRLGSSPLRALKDNIPGYRLLREDRSVLSTPVSTYVTTDD